MPLIIIILLLLVYMLSFICCYLIDSAEDEDSKYKWLRCVPVLNTLYVLIISIIVFYIIHEDKKLNKKDGL